MANKKEAPKKMAFTIQEGDYKGDYEMDMVSLNIPKIGIVKPEQLAKMPEVLEKLVKINSGAIRKVSQLEPEPDDSPELIEARVKYEELTGKSAGNRKLETLLKEIENPKAD